MAENADQLVNFFVYSLFIYPVANYIVSPQRKYPRWKAITFAVIFFAAVALAHMSFENREKGPNHFQLLGIERDTPLPQLKKAFRSISLALHPDKNPGVDTTESFRRVQQAYEVLTDKEKRREYNRLGDHGVDLAAQTVIDTRYMFLQIVVYYTSSMIFAFLMTFSEATGDAFSLTAFGMAVMALLEMLLVVKEVSLPSWLFPSYTAHDLVLTMHQLFPAYMNACRCLTSAFHRDPKDFRVGTLDYVLNSTRELASSCTNLVRISEQLVVAKTTIKDEDIVTTGHDGEEDEVKSSEVAEKTTDPDSSVTPMHKIMKEIEKHVALTPEGRKSTIGKMMKDRVAEIENARRAVLDGQNDYSEKLLWLRNFVIYLVVRKIVLRAVAKQE